jgi:hypothetical protein
MTSKLAIKLFNGRHRPDEVLHDWGMDGPLLEIKWLHTTYMTTFVLGLPSASACQFLDNWEKGRQDGVFVEGMFHYDGVFYGDYTIGTYVEETDRFDAGKAVFRKDQDWMDIPKDPDKEYDRD